MVTKVDVKQEEVTNISCSTVFKENTQPTFQKIEMNVRHDSGAKFFSPVQHATKRGEMVRQNDILYNRYKPIIQKDNIKSSLGTVNDVKLYVCILSLVIFVILAISTHDVINRQLFVSLSIISALKAFQQMSK